MDITKMKRKDFEKLKLRVWNEDIGEFDTIILLPTTHRHDSGYRCMDFVATRSGKPLCRLSGCSDVIHINGIGGCGFDWLHKYGNFPTQIERFSWSVDCLPVSGLLQIFCTERKLKAGPALSSFEVYAVEIPAKQG